MSVKVYALAIAALASTVGVAAAQSNTKPDLKALIRPGISSGMGAIGVMPGNVQANFSTGWNIYHCYTSVWYTDGSNNYEYAFNSEGTYIYAFNNAYLANEIVNICREHNEYGVYSSNGSTFFELWDKWGD